MLTFKRQHGPLYNTTKGNQRPHRSSPCVTFLRPFYLSDSRPDGRSKPERRAEARLSEQVPPVLPAESMVAYDLPNPPLITEKLKEGSNSAQWVPLVHQIHTPPLHNPEGTLIHSMSALQITKTSPIDVIRAGTSHDSQQATLKSIEEYRSCPTDLKPPKDVVHSFIDFYGGPWATGAPMGGVMPGDCGSGARYQPMEEYIDSDEDFPVTEEPPAPELYHLDEEENLDAHDEAQTEINDAQHPVDPRANVISSEYSFGPPPRLEDIEKIARQPSPGRYEHGAPLHFGKWRPICLPRVD